MALALLGSRATNTCHWTGYLNKCNPLLEEPLDVPECMLSHLTTCVYKGFGGYENEMELVRQILKAAKVLKIMKITVSSYPILENKPHFRKELSKFYRGSQNCQFVFDEGHFIWYGMLVRPFWIFHVMWFAIISCGMAICLYAYLIRSMFA